LTKGFISQIERDLTAPSITNLKQVLDVLGVSLSSFFSDVSEREKNIFTSKDRIIEKRNQKFKTEILIPKLKYLEMKPLMLTLDPNFEYNNQYQEDEGFGYVIKGNLRVKIDDEYKTLTQGDCFYIFFDSNLVIKNISKKTAEILFVNF
jgi:transcriptional regulator with XRE-family HTH domain